MSIQQWSEAIIVVELGDDPQFTDEILTVGDSVGHGRLCHVVLDLSTVTRLSPTNVLQLMLLWEMLRFGDRELRICCVPNSVWSEVLVRGLDKMFDFVPDVATALASLQIES